MSSELYTGTRCKYKTVDNVPTPCELCRKLTFDTNLIHYLDSFPMSPWYEFVKRSREIKTDTCAPFSPLCCDCILTSFP